MEDVSPGLASDQRPRIPRDTLHFLANEGHGALLSAAPTVHARPRLDRWGVAATVLGNALEFYDFLAYAAFSVYIGRAFFPGGSALTSLLLSLATFGVGFFTRPLGAVLIGAYADRAGRRPALMITIALMTVGTLGLVLTPSYASIGVAAPVILVVARLVQGFALGGEIGPSTAVLLESAPAGRRGLFISWQGASQGLAILASGVVGLLLATTLSKQQLGDWGWRVPFALGLLIVPVGFLIRSRLPETQTARGARSGPEVLRLLARDHRASLGLAVMIIMSLTVSTYVTNYMTTYALTVLHMPAASAMWGTLVNGATLALGMLIGGRLSDRFGRKPVMIVPRVALILVIYPAFLFLVRHPTLASLALVTGALTLIGALGSAAALAALTEVFPTAVRASGLAISYAVAVSVFGGTTQFAIAWFIAVSGDPLAPAYYVMVTSTISLWAMVRLQETFRR